MAGQEARIHGDSLGLIGNLVEGRLAFQIRKGEKDGCESDDPAHGPRAPVTGEAQEPAPRDQRGVVQPDRNEEQFNDEEDGQCQEARKQAERRIVRGRLANRKLRKHR